MTDLNSELSDFQRIISRKKWSAILTHQYAEGTYITFHEWNGTRTGRQVFCQVRSCVDVYTAGLRIGEYYAEGQVPMRPPMFWLVEYVPSA
jgi:hypothetical protein